jgi:hypothetical protein
MNWLIILLVVFAILALVGNPHVGGQMMGPSYPSNFGYYPSGLGLVVVIVVLFLLFR